MKSNKLARFVNYGIENAEPEMEVTEQLPEVDETLAPEQLEAETQVAENEVEQVEGDMDEMSDVAESLEAICFGIEATLKKGGMNRQAAAFALQSVDLQLNRLGLDGVSSVAVEDFAEAPQLPPATGEADPIAEASAISTGDAGKPVGTDNPTSVEPDAASVAKSEEAGVAGSDNTDATSNVAVSQEAAENIREIIRKIWEAIKAAFASLKNAMGVFLKKALDFSTLQARRAESYKKNLQSLKELVVKKEELELGSLAETLANDGKLATAAEVKAVANMLAGGTKEENKASIDALNEIVKKIKAFKEGDGTITFREQAEKLISEFDAAKAKVVKPEVAVIPGNREIRSTVAEGKTTYSAAAIDSAKPVAPATIKQPKVEELVAYCDAVIDVAKAVNAARQTSDAQAKALEAAAKAAEDASTNLAGKDEKAAAELAKFSSKQVREEMQGNLQFLKVAVGEAMRVAKAANSYVGMCYDNFASSPRIAVAKAVGV